MTFCSAPVLGAPAPGATGHRHPAAATRIHRAGGTRTGRLAPTPARVKGKNVSRTPKPRSESSGARSDSGGTRRLVIVAPASDTEVEAEQQRAAWRAEWAAREAALGVVRAQLEAQPTPHLVRATARRWCTTITQAGAAIATAKTQLENEE